MTRIRDAHAHAKSSVAEFAAATFRTYAPGLHRYLLRRIRRSDDVPDLTQVIFERLLEVNQAELIRNPQAYLYGIASHVLSQAHKGEKRSLVTYDSDFLERIADDITHAQDDDLAEQLGMARELDRALQQLAPTQRALLLMVKCDGLSYEEAARATNLTVGCVGNYVSEARAKLKAILKRV